VWAVVAALLVRAPAWPTTIVGGSSGANGAPGGAGSLDGGPGGVGGDASAVDFFRFADAIAVGGQGGA